MIKRTIKEVMREYDKDGKLVSEWTTETEETDDGGTQCGSCCDVSETHELETQIEVSSEDIRSALGWLGWDLKL